MNRVTSKLALASTVFVNSRLCGSSALAMEICSLRHADGHNFNYPGSYSMTEIIINHPFSLATTSCYLCASILSISMNQLFMIIRLTGKRGRWGCVVLPVWLISS